MLESISNKITTFGFITSFWCSELHNWYDLGKMPQLLRGGGATLVTFAMCYANQFKLDKLGKSLLVGGKLVNCRDVSEICHKLNKALAAA